MLSPEFLVSHVWNDGLARLISAEGRDRIDALLQLLSHALRSDEVMLFHFRDGAGAEVVEHRTSSKDREKQISDYKNGFYLIDPFYLAIERATQAQAISLREVVDQDEFEASEFYVRHYNETRLVDELCFVLSDGKKGYILLSFARTVENGRYTKGELDCAKALAPAMLAALASGWHHLAIASRLTSPSPEEVKLHEDLKLARSNFGRSLLTDREFEVAQMMLRGYPIDLISKRLKMAEGTTKVHRRNIYRKLDINSKAELFSLFIDVVGEVEVSSDVDPLEQYNGIAKGR